MTLYFINAPQVLKIKIGISDDFPARLNKLRREGPVVLEVLNTFNGERDSIQELERDIHSELSGSNDHHEWFHDTPEVRAALDRLDRQFNPELYKYVSLDLEDYQ